MPKPKFVPFLMLYCSIVTLQLPVAGLGLIYSILLFAIHTNVWILNLISVEMSSGLLRGKSSGCRSMGMAAKPAGWSVTSASADAH